MTESLHSPSKAHQDGANAPTLVPYPQVPKVNTKKDGNIPADLAKRPEITITPIPRSHTGLGPATMQGPLPAGLSPMPPGLKGLQLADLITLEGLKTTFGMTALQDLAKIAER